jgi:glyoxylase-like metal-dependent hydrolase (beta-lactamase superfamily II)
MNIHSFVFNPFYENTYVLYDESGEALIIDPGCYESYEQGELVAFIAEKKLTPVAVVNTHCHVDHVLGNAFCKKQFGIPLWIPSGEKEVYSAVHVYSANYGFTRYEAATVDVLIPQAGELTFGQSKLSILFAPGHAPGHLMYYHKETSNLIAGDVIFRESIGRTDLPGGDLSTLEKSIREQVYALPDTVIIYPGHGPTTSVSHEKTNNPFVKP